MSLVHSYLKPKASVLVAPAKYAKRKGGIAVWLTMPLALWALLWLSINTGPWNLSEFGKGLTGSINAVRAAFPLIVCAVALLSLGSRGRRRTRSWAETGFWIYGFVMLLACTGANYWFGQAYWGIAFVGTLAVAGTGLRTEEPLEFARKLNCLSWVVTSLVLVTMLFLARDVLYSPNTNSAYGVVNRFQEAYGYTISRSSGLSRMAAVPAIISLVFLFAGRTWQRLLSLGVLIAAFSVIWIMQSRGALFAFVGAFLFVLFFGDNRAQKIGILIVVVLTMFAVVGATSQGTFHDLWLHATREEGAAGFSNMSGRNVIWREALEQWMRSPLFGYGPQADRLFEVNAQNAVVYALLCGGLIGATFFVVAMVTAWKALLALVLTIRRLPRQERAMFQVTGAILVFSTLRSYPENEATVFSIDLLLQYPAMIYLVVLAARIKRSRMTV